MSEIPSQSAAGLGGKILAQLKGELGSAWDQRLSQADRDLLKSVSQDAATVVLLGLTGPADQAQREKAQVDAQMLNIASAEAAWVTDKLWSAATVAVKTALGFALALA